MTAAPNQSSALFNEQSTAAHRANDSAPRTASVEPPTKPIRPSAYALLGNPNTGKTTLFNRLCGARAKTANFPGSTVEARIGNCDGVQVTDLPGIYGLNLDRPESRLCSDYLAGRVRVGRAPQALLVVADATNLPRNLIFASQALQQGLPAVIALNMTDLAQRRGLTIDVHQLSEYLGCPVVSICARSGEGVEDLIKAMREPVLSTADFPDPKGPANAAARWANGVVAQSVGGDHAVGLSRGAAAADTFTDRLDAAFTHPFLGVLVFAAVMVALFYTIFTLATVPMDLIDLLFEHLSNWVHAGFAGLQNRFGWNLVDGPLHNLLIDGVIGGIAGTVVFLPQICLLFFLITLLEDTGYLARASFVMDRLLRRFGLPGQAFVPMLSAHACAIPAIMSARLIPDQRDRVATIFVMPFLSCSARLPVYVLLISVLFAGQALWAGVAFAGCYLLGGIAALMTALLFRRTILKGPARPMVLELPTYKLPSLRTALITSLDRAVTFLRKAGTVIVGICMLLWWLSAYPQAPAGGQSPSLIAAQSIADPGPVAGDATSQLTHSFAGRLGKAIEPVFSPLGYDWQLSIGVLTSFAAREVFVSTMSVLFAGTDDTEDQAVLDRIRSATRDDGSPVFTKSTAASLLVFYVLAMQCLPTLAVTRRETGSWKWAGLQLGYMTLVAYIAALLARSILLWIGVA
ncbi:MAG: ferrous iron transporter B [Phycisphaerales bacterium]|nr:ferrous iron transporter B [Phycisphaerales bacterium]MCI0629029.1 ferrous iron transporter B [Phycisphaerales bacterium]